VLALAAQAVSAKQLGAETRDKPSVRVSQHRDVVLAQAVPSVAVAGSAAVLTAVPKSVPGTVIGGATAGLGLAWLASTLGFGDAVAPLLLMALIAAAVLLAVGLRRRRRTTAPSDLALQSASSDNGSGSGKSQLDPLTPRGYSSKNVGNDASARPWEQQPAMPEPSADSPTGSVLGSTPSWGVPDGFDTVGFLKVSKANFVSLQAAWDRSDIAALRAMMTDGMLEQIKAQLAEREQIQGDATNQTDVVMLEARLLGLEEIGPGYLASVEFSGLIREDASVGPNPFREVWNITRAKSGPGGWLVAGVQALQ
jgi:predicted lipid-binding transport protein (Tim44 family)